MRAVLFAILLGCGDVREADLAGPDAWGEAPARAASLRRLSRAQYVNAVRDLFGPDVVIPAVAEPDVKTAGLVALGGASSTWSQRGVESVEDAAYSLAAQAMANPAIRHALVRCSPDAPDCAEQTLVRLGRRAWRRPLSAEEGRRLADVAHDAAAALGSLDAGLEFGIAGLLQSPHFLFRVELGEGGLFSDVELASRLSFFLWNTGPDEALLDEAESGALATDEGLLAAATRMLDDPRARDGLRAFFVDHLELAELDSLKKDPTVFEHFAPELGPDAREETLRLLEYVALDAELDYRDVLTTRQTFVNPRMATLYGIPAPGLDWTLVELPAGGRAGLLGHASFLNAHAHPLDSSATLRGKAVRTTLMCQLIPPPPVDVDTSIPEPSGTAPTLRDRVAEHLTNPSCAACHSRTDPIGLALENFDAVGRWRDDDHGVRIDASGELDGLTFVGPLGLGGALRAQKSFSDCFVRTLGRYATGALEAEEDPWLEVLFERFEHHGYQVRPLILEVVMSPLFRRAGEPR